MHVCVCIGENGGSGTPRGCHGETFLCTSKITVRCKSSYLATRFVLCQCTYYNMCMCKCLSVGENRAEWDPTRLVVTKDNFPRSM